MKRYLLGTSIVCGMLITLAAFPVFGQKDDPVTEIEVNKRPIQDFAAFARKEIETGLDLNAEFVVELEGTLTKDGRIDAKTARFKRTDGDPRMVALIRKSIESVNDAGYFSYLTALSAQNLILVIAQDKENLRINIASEFETEARSKSTRSALELMVSLGKHQKNRDNATESEKDDLLLLESVIVGSEGKKLFIKSVLPKATVKEMIERNLSKHKVSS